MKSHELPYGCTFLTCNKTFDSKNDWKRHENSQHFHLETWRCDKERLEGGACAKVCYRKESFQDHLVKVHEIDLDKINTIVENCRIGRNCQARFWCGFCRKLVELKRKGVDAWTERFDHIDDHFMGRHGQPKQKIQEWVPMDSDRPKAELEDPHSLDSPDEDNETFGPAQSAAGSLAHATRLDEDHAALESRRDMSSSGVASAQFPREYSKAGFQDKALYPKIAPRPPRRRASSVNKSLEDSSEGWNSKGTPGTSSGPDVAVYCVCLLPHSDGRVLI